MKRAVIIVLDSVGIGELPDAGKFGDCGSNTIVNIQKAVPEMKLENMAALGLGNIPGEGIASLGKVDAPKGAFGKMAEKSIGKDTTTGHWEMAGVITSEPFPTFSQNGFPRELMDAFEQAIGRKTLGNIAISGTEIIKQLGEEHQKTGSPIVYTSADSVFQIAAHEETIPLDALYEICQTAREMLTGKNGVARVIARPFVGAPGNYTRTKNRRDFSIPPTGTTILDLAYEQGQQVIAVGKIEDIFAHRSISKAYHTTNNNDGIEKTIALLSEVTGGLLFTNLVDYDMVYGHRNDIAGYSDALVYFDKQLPRILEAMRDDDILFITADHGCDPTFPGTDHTREYVPLLVYGRHVQENVNLGIRETFADLAQTVSDYLGLPNVFEAKSFLNDIIDSCRL